MFEGVVAHLLNKYLGKYIKDLDSENLNVGIFNGTVQLTDLKLKAEALYELELPIEVKAGCIGKVSVDIPWLSLSSEPVLVHVEDVLILAGPISNDPYDADKERLLARARKARRLELLEEPFAENELDKPRGFFENLIGTIVNNVQVSVQNVHIRYEDTVTSPQYPFACGVVLQSLTAITTSSKWKPIQLDSASKTIYKLVKLESFSIYWSYCCSASGLIRLQLPSSNWKNLMKRALQTFSIGSDEFDFVLKPISAKVKIIFNKSLESKIPKLLVDVLLQDVALQLSRQQYLEVILLGQSFTLMEINQRYRKYRPNVPCKGNAKVWWKYAFDAVVGEYIRPYSWKAIKEHRQNYRQYKELYKKRLQKPNDAEIRVDVQMMEDKLNIANVIMAREEAKLELLRSEPNRAVPRKKDKGWWASWFGSGEEEEPVEGIEVIGERERSFWSRLTPEEKEKLYEAIEYADASTEVPEQYIAHKVNFTLANCTLALVGSTSGHEVLVATLTQFLTSLETRPGARAFKVSARTEGFVVEGTSSDHDLVTVLSVDKSASEISPQHVFALDFEQNPLDINANYGLMLCAEPVEVVYNEHSVSELLTFFSIPTVSAADIRSLAAEQFNYLATWSKTGLLHALTHRKTFFVNIEFKSPYFVVHEHGSFQKSGNILVIDMGKLSFKSDLQSDSLLLEEATKMEIEEKLYDRFNICLSDIQVLFTDSGEEWRMARLLPESDMHLVPKIKLQALFSNSVKPDYRFLPRHKLNVSVSSLKLNLSDRRLGLLMEFAHNFPLPHLLASGDAVDGPSKEHLECLVCESVKADESTKVEPSTEELKLIRQHVTQAPSATLGRPSRSSTQLSIAGSEQYLSASDYSDEELEDWGRTLDVPGFDDNVSASNTVNSLLRFVIGEVALHLARSSDQVDKPYLMLRLDKLCADVALMEYGPALQASINGIYLVDKLHIGPTGEYLELLSSKAAEDMVSLLYRKVKASCPEFKSNFHQVEHSAVIDFTSVSITFHREALLTLGRYLLYVYQKLNMKDVSYSSLLPEAAVKQATGLFLDEQDPPVPPGSTKLNVALRLHEIKARLCDVDLELADLCVSGLECDYIQKANEKMIVRVDLTHLSVTDLMESTLYSKVLSIEDDKLFDFKYVRKAPRTKSLEMEEEKLKGPDGTVRFHVGRMQLVLLRRFFVDVQKFLEPFLQPEARSVMFKSAEKVVQQQVADFAQKSAMLQLSIDIHAPTVLIPQKSDSPNLIVLSLGDLNIENFFKEVSSRPKPDYVDNILVRFSSLHMTRAIVLLDGSIQPQESILEPMKLNLDIKRALTLFNRNIMEYEVRGTMDLVKVNIGQKDLGTIFAIFKENFEEKEVIESHHQVSTPMSPPVVASPALADDPVKKLQTFLTTSVDVYKKTNVFFTMEGLHIVLYADAEDAPLSSPVRDPLHALSKLELEEVTTNLDLFSDQSLEFKCSLQSLLLEDTRSDSTLVHTRVFCSSSGDSETVSAGISVSSPNMVDITYRETTSGDATVDVLIEETSLKVSVPYLLALLNFVYEALPPPARDQQRELQRAVEGAGAPQGGSSGGGGGPQQGVARRRLPSDNTSGYHSVVSGAVQDDTHGISFSLVLKKPEVVFFADPRQHESEVIVLKMDIMMDYCRNLGQQTMTASVINLNASSFFWGRRKDTLYTIIKPFNIELNQSYSASNEEQKLQAKTSDISIHLSSHVLSTASSIVTELLSSLKEVTAPEDPFSRQDSADLLELWSPKAVSPPRLQEGADERASCRKSSAYQSNAPAESLDISIPRLSVVFEIDTAQKKVPALFLQASLETDVHDWSRKMYMTADVKLEALYYSEERSTWEPFIEPVMQAENCYRPWELVIKVFRDRSYPILSAQDNRSSNLLLDAVDGLDGASTGSCGSVSTSDDASEEETEMTVIRRHPPARPKRALSHKSRESSTLVAMDSDSENDENVLQRIAHAFGHLFSDHSSEEEQSDGEATAGVKSESEETEMADNELSTTDDRPVFLEKGDAPDSAADNASGAALATYILVDSRDSLNLNITPTATNIFFKLWNDIQKREGRPRQPGCPSEALVIDNLLGPEALVSVLIKDESERFVVAQQAWGQAPAFSPTASKMPVAIAGGDFRRQRSVELQGEDVEAASTPLSSVAVFEEKPLCDLYKERTTEKIALEVPGFEKFQCWMPRKAGSSLFALHPMKNKLRYFFILEVKIENGTKTITARSPLRLENHLGRPVQLLCEKSSLEAVGVAAERYAKNPFHETHIRLATLAPGGAAYSVPLFVAYHSRIYLQPTSLTSDCAGYEPSTDGLWSQDIVLCNKSAKFLSCKFKDPQQEQLFWMKVVCKETRDTRMVAQGTMLVPNCTLHIVAPIVVHNSLPYPIELRLKSLPREIKLDEGDSAPIFSVPPNGAEEVAIEVPYYLGSAWKGRVELSASADEGRVVSMQPQQALPERMHRQLSIATHLATEKSLELFLHAPYWVINKTGLPLQIRGSSSDIIYDCSASSEELLLFRFKKRKHKKAKIRVYNSSWSSSFCLDTVGNNGVVVCKDKERNKKYRFFLRIQMSRLSLSKIISITPFFLVANNTKHYFRFMEENEAADLWFDIGPQQCLPFWPDTDSMKMYLRHKDSTVTSQHFYFGENQNTALRMDNGSAVCVEVSGGVDGPKTISLFPYSTGDAPVRVENLCEDLFLKIHQKCLGQVTLLSPYQSVLYTWDDPTIERTLMWNLYNRKKPGFIARIHRDGFGKEKVSFRSLRPPVTETKKASKKSSVDQSSTDDDSESENGVLPKKTRRDIVLVYWISFLDQNQRVLLFTQDERIWKHARKAVDGEKSHLECFVSLHGVGVSLVNAALVELAYLSLSSAPAQWEVKVNDAWKPLTLVLAAWLEYRWSCRTKSAELKDYVQVDFEKMQMTKPFLGLLQRTYHPALWLQFRQSDQQTLVLAKIRRVQLDNQLPDAQFPTVLYRFTPQSKWPSCPARPMLEAALLLHHSPRLNLNTIKYLKLLLQEVHVKLDKGFLLSVFDVFSGLLAEPDEKTKLRSDMKLIYAPLYPFKSDLDISRSQRTVFEFVHFSPAKIHLSFSPRGTVHKAVPDQASLSQDILDVFLNSVGATLSEVKDVELRMAFFEQKGRLVSTADLLSEVRSHYVSQVVQQSYVLILGLDVLGNPYGLVKDFTRGFGDFFYEPIVGSIQGPEEFAEGLSRGAQSLMGHVVGSSAGSVALITGSLGQALAVLSFDEDYQRKRRLRMEQHSSSLPESLVAAAKGFVMGILLGVSGVVMNPVTGAQLEGLEGFFKGIGKGLLGLMTKPTGGVVDMFSIAFDGIRRAAEMGKGVVVRQRLPRFINPNLGLQPFSQYQATGYRLLLQLSKGHYSLTDTYWAHAPLGRDDRANIAMVTDRHVFLLEKCRFWGGWGIQWSVRLEDVVSVPSISGNSLVVRVRQDETVASFTGSERFLVCEDEDVLQWLKLKIEKVLLVTMEERPCSLDS